MNERPPCFGCNNPAHIIIGRRAYCGECALKIQNKREADEEEKIKEILK